MKKIITIIFLLVLGQVTLCQAKIIITSGYGFGFAASFADSVVYITPIQKMDSLFMDSKSKLVIGTENFSAQLKDYMESQLDEAGRTCVFFYDIKEANLQKQLKKLRKRYSESKNGHFIIREVSEKDFRFICMDMTDQMDAKSKALEAKKAEKTKKQDKHSKHSKRSKKAEKEVASKK
ncbi:MAG: hypothetical protein KBS94_05175 [Prevotella sp.]|nr:hypothetical protein [Candidatus Equicola faecalis]MDO4819244.1 hypothetical protein [Prevotella sp.]